MPSRMLKEFSDDMQSRNFRDIFAKSKIPKANKIFFNFLAL